MSLYAGTSLLCSLYATDANSPPADAWRQRNPAPLPFTAFHRLELRNALNLAVFQKRITPLEAQAAWQEVENDVSAGLLVPQGGVWHRVLREAEQILQRHSASIGCRTLDVIHVAAAIMMAATSFCTFDLRQADLGRRVGLPVMVP